MAGSPLKKARRLAAAAKPIDPLDEAPPRPALAPIPWNKVDLNAEQRALVAAALAARRTRAEVAEAMGISQTTLRRLIRDDPALTEAVDSADQAELDEIRSLLLAHGRAGDTVALIFLGKAFHGLRDRDDAGAKIAATKAGGVLVVPVTSLEDWERSTYEQQAQYRETSKFEPVADFRTCTAGVDGLRLQRTELSDLPS
jgi:hypothetical protein